MIRANVANGASGPTPEAHCTSKPGPGGCVPTLTLSGAPDVNAGSGFALIAASAPNQKSSLLSYSLVGHQNSAFGGGSLCVVPPLRRAGALQSGGPATGNDCTGTLAFDFNTFSASGLDPALVAGVIVDAQLWRRDPGFPAPQYLGLTRGAHFGLAPWAALSLRAPEFTTQASERLLRRARTTLARISHQNRSEAVKARCRARRCVGFARRRPVRSLRNEADATAQHGAG